MKKALCMFLAVLMLCSVLASCGGNAVDTTGIDTAGGPEETGSDTEAEEKPDLPEGVTYDGYAFTTLVSGTLKYSDFDADVNDASYGRVNEAIRRRNLAIQDKYQITMNNISDFGTSFGNGPGFKRVMTDYQSGDCSYDVCMVGTYDAAQLALSLYLHDLNDTKYLDLSKSWWDQKANTDLGISGVMFYTTGDISFIDNICTHMIMFNKGLAKELELTTPYELVENGQWNFDNFTSYIKKASTDLDGNQTRDQADRYGLLTWNDVIHQIFHSADQRIAAINDRGNMELTVYNEVTSSLVSDYMDILGDKNLVFNYSNTSRGISSNNWDTVRKTMFDNNQALFYSTLFTTVPKHRDSYTDFGILPWPKYSETQEHYGHYVSATHAQMLCIEETNNDLDRTSMIVEDLAYNSKQLVTPAYYNDTLIGQYMRDEDSISMLDIIFASHIFDVGIYYKVGTTSQTIAANLTGIIESNTNNFTQRYESFRTAATTMITSINDQFASVLPSGN